MILFSYQGENALVPMSFLKMKHIGLGHLWKREGVRHGVPGLIGCSCATAPSEPLHGTI